MSKTINTQLENLEQAINHDDEACILIVDEIEGHPEDFAGDYHGRQVTQAEALELEKMDPRILVIRLRDETDEEE